MQPLPIPCPAHLVPDATDLDAFNAAYRAAKAQRTVFLAIERQGQRWTIKADALTAPDHVVDDTINHTIRAAVARLVRSGEIHADAIAGPVYLAWHGVQGEDRARELAAALHAALYGDVQPLALAVPTKP
ncbi:hypothetical protein ACRJ4B_00450 [Streptomyces sp. GTA36]